MRRFMVCVAILSWTVSCALAAPAQTFRMTKAALREPAMAMVLARLSREKPDNAGEMPDFGTENVWFSHLKLGDNDPMLMALIRHEDRRPSIVNDRDGRRIATFDQGGQPDICLDLDGDRDLADEDVLTPASVRRIQYLVTPPITVPVTYELADGSTVQQDFRFRICVGNREMAASQLAVMFIFPEHCWQGWIEFGGQKLLMTLTDATGDAKIVRARVEGSFPGYLQGAHDMCWIDRDGDRAVDEDFQDTEQLPLTRYVSYAGEFYALDVRPDGAQVTVRPYQGDPAILKITATDGNGRPTTAMMLKVRGPQARVWLKEPSDEVRVPPGEYATTYTLAKPGDASRRYTFVRETPMKLEAGQTTELALGGKLELDVGIQQRREDDDVVLRVSLSPKTKAGHEFRGAVGGDASFAPGTVELRNAAGDIVATGKAEYG